MINPREVDDLIAAMNLAGWPEPKVTSAYFCADETGPMLILLHWEAQKSYANYRTGFGWTDMAGPWGRLRYSAKAQPFEPEDVVDNLLLWARAEQRA